MKGEELISKLLDVAEEMGVRRAPIEEGIAVMSQLQTQEERDAYLRRWMDNYPNGTQ